MTLPEKLEEIAQWLEHGVSLHRAAHVRQAAAALEQAQARQAACVGALEDAKKFAELVDERNPTAWAKSYIKHFSVALALLDTKPQETRE